ncbi:MAG: hypothetical protein ACFFG0_31775 [Candidatus Thorarchaeota archaeon]
MNEYQDEELDYLAIEREIQHKYITYDYKTNLRNMEQKLKDANLDLDNLPFPLDEEFDKYKSALKKYYDQKENLNMKKKLFHRVDGKRVRTRRIKAIGLWGMGNAEMSFSITLNHYFECQVLPKFNLKF